MLQNTGTFSSNQLKKNGKKEKIKLIFLANLKQDPFSCSKILTKTQDIQVQKQLSKLGDINKFKTLTEIFDYLDCGLLSTADVGNLCLERCI